MAKAKKERKLAPNVSGSAKANPSPVDSVVFRVAQIGDIQNLVALEKLCFRTYYKNHQLTVANFLYYVKNPHAVVRLAIIDAEIVGYVLGIVQTGQRSHIARIHSLAVTPRIRRMHIATRLVQKFNANVKKRKRRTIMLEVATANIAGLRFFSKQGFEQMQHLPDHYGPGLDGMRMALTL